MKCDMLWITVGSAMLALADGDALIQNGRNLTVTGEANISVTNVEFEIDVAAGGNAIVDPAYPVTVRAQAGGSVTLRGDAWQDKVGLWLDASAEWTLEATTNSEGVVQFTYDSAVDKRGAYITRWRDRRPEQTEWIGYNNRSVGAPNAPVVSVLPYVVSNGCNGLTYVTTGNQVQFGRRMPFIRVVDGVEMGDTTSTGVGTGTYHPSYVMDVKYMIMVFGSQRGGGQTVAGNLARASTSGTVTADVGIFGTVRTTRLDGEIVDPTATGLNGGWQVLSFATIKGDLVTGLPGTVGNAQYGGQNYAEVLVFTNMPTSCEIASAERYLAAKWGVSTYSASGVAGETRLYGEGTATVASGEVPLGGEFSGTVTVAADATLTLTDSTLVPTNPVSGMAGWWDPDRADSLTTSAATVGGETVQRISTMYNLASAFNGKANNLIAGGRGPRVMDDVRGWGTEHAWCDYNTNYTGGTGNTLRLNDSADGVDNCLATRTGFMVLDTTEGGGTPFLDTSIYSFNGTLNSRYVMARVGTSPIFRTQTGTPAFDPAEDAYVVTNSPVYLDGIQVNSGKRGYNSRTELLSFMFSKEIPIRCFGAWQQENAYSSTIGLRHGEIILYPTELSDADRKATEAYLMKKWLGKTPSGYGDPSRMTITGVGTVKTANGSMRPKAYAGFSGTLNVTGTTISFTIAASADAPVEDAISLPDGTLATANALTVDLTFKALPSPGNYTLVSAKSWNAATVSLGDVTGCIGARKASLLRLARSGNELVLQVVDVGTSLVIR